MSRLLVNCMYDRETNEVAPQPIVGVRAMHDTLKRWLTETGLELRPHSRV